MDYLTWTTDSRRWLNFRFRSGDVVIAAYPKAGTTWMQRIVDLLFFGDARPRDINALSPWLDGRLVGAADVVHSHLDAQEHRRFIKSHLPFDGLPCRNDVFYIHVARDGRDICMSYYKHCASFSERMHRSLEDAKVEIGSAFPRDPGTVVDFWKDWHTRGVGPSAQDGYPGLSFFSLEKTWWRARGRKNVLLVHYNDLLANLALESCRIASFLGIDRTTEEIFRLSRHATFQQMKLDAESLMPGAGEIFDGGAKHFFYRGQNGRWRDEIPFQEQNLYEKKASELFTPGLDDWIRHGRKWKNPAEMPD